MFEEYPKQEWYLQIDDGEYHKVEGTYKCGLGNGAYCGSDEHTERADVVRHMSPSGVCVGLVSAWWDTDDGGIDGIAGIFKRVKWGTHPDNDCPVLKVWERIA